MWIHYLQKQTNNIQEWESILSASDPTIKAGEIMANIISKELNITKGIPGANESSGATDTFSWKKYVIGDPNIPEFIYWKYLLWKYFVKLSLVGRREEGRGKQNN